MRLATFALLLLLAACSRSGRPDVSSYAAGHETLSRLCGNPALLGEPLDAISEGACGIDTPVAVHVVAGVALSTPATLNCRTANTLAKWGENDAQDAVRGMRSRITGMRVLASYACRSRNSQRGARLSEHARGNGIDIASFTLANGEEISVEYDWRGRGKKTAALHKLYNSACGPYGTVLGPDSDRFHYNHFHLDTAEYRSGSYCR